MEKQRRILENICKMFWRSARAFFAMVMDMLSLNYGVYMILIL